MKPLVKDTYRFFVRSHSIQFISFYVAAAFGAITNVLLPVSIGGLTAIMDSGSSAKSKLFGLIPFHPQTLKGFFLFFTLVLIVRIASIYYTESKSRSLAEKLAATLREKLFESIAYMKPEYYNREGKSNISQRFFNDMTYIKSWLTKLVLGAPSDIMLLILSLCLLFAMSWQVAIGIIVILILFAFISLGFAKIVKDHTRERNEKRSAMMQKVIAFSENYLSVKILNREKLAVDDFTDANNQFYTSNIPINQKKALIEAIQPFQIFAIIGWILYYFSVISMHGETSSMMTSVLLILYSQGPMRRLTRIPGIKAQAELSFDSIEKQFNRKPESESRSKEMSAIYGLISFDDQFVQPSTTAKIVTQNSGWTQNFLHTWMRTKSGRMNILLDKIPLTTLEPFEVRKRTAFISHNISPVGENIYKIISYSANPEKSESAIRLLKKLNVDCGPSGLDATLTEIQKLNGPDLFWKLNVARAVFSKKEIIIAQIPWTELSAEGTESICNVLNSYRGKRTILIIGNNPPENLITDKSISI